MEDLKERRRYWKLKDVALLLSGEMKEDLFTYKGYLNILPPTEIVQVFKPSYYKTPKIAYQTYTH